MGLSLSYDGLRSHVRMRLRGDVVRRGVAASGHPGRGPPRPTGARGRDFADRPAGCLSPPRRRHCREPTAVTILPLLKSDLPLEDL